MVLEATVVLVIINLIPWKMVEMKRETRPSRGMNHPRIWFIIVEEWNRGRGPRKTYIHYVEDENDEQVSTRTSPPQETSPNEHESALKDDYGEINANGIHSVEKSSGIKTV